MFVNRLEELKGIQQRLADDEFQFIIIFGRRRIGKTRMIIEAVKDKPHIYYMATENGNLDSFLSENLGKIPELEYSAKNWEAYFRLMKDRIVVIDEFPNLILEDASVISVFQKIVDTLLAGTRTKLIVLGSSITMMRDKVLSYSSPLYGRRTSSLKLEALRFRHLIEFFPGTDPEELCLLFGVTDGIPYYVEKARMPFWEWLGSEIQRPDSFLRDEVDFLLRYEFKDVGTYKRILEAIALGNHTPSDIRNHIGVKHSDIMPYLRNLQEVEMIERRIPITENERSRRGRYYLKDRMLSFWFRFIHRNRSSIQEGFFDIDSIRKDYQTYMGSVFERIATEFVIDMIKDSRLPMKYDRIGRWWHGGDEVDIVCINDTEKRVLLIEVKWSDLHNNDVKRILGGLEEKSKKMPLNGYSFDHGIVARRSEYKPGLVYDLEDLEQLYVQEKL